MRASSPTGTPTYYPTDRVEPITPRHRKPSTYPITAKSPADWCDRGLLKDQKHTGFTTDTQWENPLKIGSHRQADRGRRNDGNRGRAQDLRQLCLQEHG